MSYKFQDLILFETCNQYQPDWNLCLASNHFFFFCSCRNCFGRNDWCKIPKSVNFHSDPSCDKGRLFLHVQEGDTVVGATRSFDVALIVSLRWVTDALDFVVDRLQRLVQFGQSQRLPLVPLSCFTEGPNDVKRHHWLDDAADSGSRQGKNLFKYWSRFFAIFVFFKHKCSFKLISTKFFYLLKETVCCQIFSLWKKNASWTLPIFCT